MIFLLIALIVLLAFGSKFTAHNKEYLSRKETDSWKGFFAVLILYSHMTGYLTFTESLDSAFSFALSGIDQLMVVMYFFYSGYGILESFKSKPGYPSAFLRRRFFPTWIRFILAVALFLILQTCLGTKFGWKEYAFCWTGWEGIGNSNWFIFDMLVLYLATGLAFAAGRGDSLRVCTAVTIFSLMIWATLRWGFPEKGSWWHNTVWAFPLGFWYSHFKDRIENLTGNWKTAGVALAVSAAGVALCSHGSSNSLFFPFKTCFFALSIVFLSSFWSIGNTVLVWLGKHCFPIYILQRLPMILLAHFGLNERIWLFAIISILVTLVLAAGFSFVCDKLVPLLCPPNPRKR